MMTMRTMTLIAAAALLLVGLSAVPAATASDCNGLVNVTCTYTDGNGNQQNCVLWVAANAPNVPNCIVGG
jgi:hypothetical protein